MPAMVVTDRTTTFITLLVRLTILMEHWTLYASLLKNHLRTAWNQSINGVLFIGAIILQLFLLKIKLY